MGQWVKSLCFDGLTHSLTPTQCSPRDWRRRRHLGACGPQELTGRAITVHTGKVSESHSFSTNTANAWPFLLKSQRKVTLIGSNKVSFFFINWEQFKQVKSMECGPRRAVSHWLRDLLLISLCQSFLIAQWGNSRTYLISLLHLNLLIFVKLKNPA